MEVVVFVCTQVFVNSKLMLQLMLDDVVDFFEFFRRLEE